MIRKNFLPKAEMLISNNFVQDSLTKARFEFSKFDSTIADFEIKSLKNDWPFVDENNSKPFIQLFARRNFIDSLFKHGS